MKNFEKFQSRALKGDALKEIKGGMSASDPCHVVTPECANYYQYCASSCYDLDVYYYCVLSYTMNCSPLVGYDNVCIYHCP